MTDDGPKLDLIEELDDLTEAGRQLQGASPRRQEGMALRYQEWFTKAIGSLSGEAAMRFRDAYEGEPLDNRIRGYLLDPDRTEGPDQTLIDPLEVFVSHARYQRQLLLEAIHAPGGQDTLGSEPAIAADRSELGEGQIFVVHGHDHARLHELVRLLERTTERNVVVLREQPNRGRTIIEKFEDYAAATSFAVVLLTADDLGRARTEDEDRGRARQNVVFESGFFVAKLGRGRVAMMHDPGVELPSDLAGILYIPLDGDWKLQLSSELEEAGVNVDRHRLR